MDEKRYMVPNRPVLRKVRTMRFKVLTVKLA